MKALVKHVSIAVALMPLVSFAALPTSIESLWSNVIKKAFNWFVVIFFLFATYQFLMAGWEYLSGGGENQEEVRGRLLYGAVGVAVGLLAFVIPAIVSSFLGGNLTTTSPLLPQMEAPTMTAPY